MNKTKIEWVKNPDGSQGYTWNPITGCLNNCPYCYARKLANGRLKARYLGNDNMASLSHMTTEEYQAIRYPLRCTTDPFYPRFWPEKLNRLDYKKSPYGRTKPYGIFCCDMSDLFGIGVPDDWTWDVLDHIRLCSQHRFYILTKQPQNLAKFSPFPDNCWVGVSVDDGDKMKNWGPPLRDIKASVKYLSFEPLLNIPDWWDHNNLSESLLMADISWLIIGTQTKPYRPPKIEWVKEIVEAADQAGVPVFLKNNLHSLFEQHCRNQIKETGNVPNFMLPEWAGQTSGGYRKLRQEMPRQPGEE